MKMKSRRRTKNSSSSSISRKSLQESSESDQKDTNRSRTLHHMEKELDSATNSDSDELMLLSKANTNSRLGSASVADIYSDTDSDSQEQTSHSKLITKAAVKQFSGSDIAKNTQKSLFAKEAARKDEDGKNKENVKTTKKKDNLPSSLIVPQRQAAKKASEIMQRSTVYFVFSFFIV